MMNSVPSSSHPPPAAASAAEAAVGATDGAVLAKDKVASAAAAAAAAAPPPPSNLSMVDPFLVEALQNPRHRLTILRMELDIQKFLQNSDLPQFEFQHFPTSYIRLAAHKVAQHYGLLTMVKDNAGDGLGARILVKKQTECKYPTVCLSDMLAKELETEKNEQIKIVIKSRPRNACQNEVGESGLKHGHMRTVEERREEYDRVRARIFSGSSGAKSYDILTSVPSDGKNSCLSLENNENLKSSTVDLEKNIFSRENAASSRVAILRDREKERVDPDYDRTYEKYIRYAPSNQAFSYVQKFQHPYVQYDSVLPQLGQLGQTQACLNYSSPVMGTFCALGLNQTSRDVVYMQWPSQSLMYAQSYGQLRHAVFQAPSCQQPLSFDHSQKY